MIDFNISLDNFSNVPITKEKFLSSEMPNSTTQKIVITIGISGSGKSTLYETQYQDFALIEADKIREKLTGDISNQEHEQEVWDTYYKVFLEHLTKGDNIYLSATHLSLWSINRELDFIKQHSRTDNVSVKLLLFTISNNPDECYKRVEKDITEGKNRSKTIGVKATDGSELIYSMSNRYRNLVKDKRLYDLIKLYSMSYKVEIKLIL